MSERGQNGMDALQLVQANVVACRKCPRLVAHRERVAREKVRRYREDGLTLRDCYITAAVRCAPPDNKPTPQELATCQPYLVEEIRLLRYLRVVVALGRIAFEAFLKAWVQAGRSVPFPRPRFAHGAVAELPGGVRLIASYHPSQQNTQTGRLTAPMFHRIFARARQALGSLPPNRAGQSTRQK